MSTTDIFFPLINRKKEIYFFAILPNLIYKNNEIYFIFRNKYLNLKIKEETKIIKEYILKNKNLKNKFYLYYYEFEIEYEILKEQLSNGIKVKILYDNNKCKNFIDKQKIARSVEADIIGINLNDDEENYDYRDDLINYNYEDECINYIKENINNDMINDNYDNNEILENNLELFERDNFEEEDNI